MKVTVDYLIKLMSKETYTYSTKSSIETTSNILRKLYEKNTIQVNPTFQAAINNGVDIIWNLDNKYVKLNIPPSETGNLPYLYVREDNNKSMRSIDNINENIAIIINELR